MREKAIRFGDAQGLFGILTEPKGPAEGAPAVIFLNSGLVHRIGVSRLYVHAARAFAAQGHLCLRFDFSGIGDSEPRRDSLTFEAGAVEEVRAAIDFLVSTKRASSVVLVGLCSGADMAFYAAQTDDRVIAVCQLDPFVYRTPYFQIRRYAPRLLRLSSWANLVTGRNKIGRALRRFGTPISPAETTSDTQSAGDFVLSPYARAFPPKADVEAGLSILAERGVLMLNIFSSGMVLDYNYQGQYRRAFRNVRFGGRMQEVYFPLADHVFSSLEEQRRAVELMRGWLALIPAAAAPADDIHVPAGRVVGRA